ncbi:MAG TPA: ATP synthase subunit I [Candidatus Acidoferrum sp.]|nr:ATP synthase subunit I [Candidatus Acidoferrum sp.]
MTMEGAEYSPMEETPEANSGVLSTATSAVDLAAFARTERRIAWLTLVIGGASSVAVAVFRHPQWAAGLAIGTVLAWFNFRWLKRGLDALVAVSTAQEGFAKPRIPVGTWFRLMFRYGLIGFCVYVIFDVLKVPLASMVVGLCALGAATIAASVYEILRPEA